MLDQLNPLFVNDPDIQGAVDAIGREVDRMEAQMLNIRANFISTTASDFISIWERIFGLDPTGKTIAQRQTILTAFFQRLRKDSSGLSWQERLTELIGSNFSYNEDHPLDLVELYTEPFSLTWPTGWTFDYGASSEFTLSTDPGETGDYTASPNTTGDKRAVIGTDWLDEWADIQFTVDEVGTNPILELILKRISATSCLVGRIDPDADTIRIGKVVAGAFTSMATAAVTLTQGTVYWARAKIIGNVVTLVVYSKDPLKDITATVGAAASFTLITGDLTTYGAAVAGKVGFGLVNASTGWVVDHFRGGRIQANPAYTIRIVLPYAGSTGLIAGDVERFLRQITPANTDLIVTYGDGFILDVSQLDQEAL